MVGFDVLPFETRSSIWHGRDSLSKVGANSKDFCSNQFQHLEMCGDSRVDPLSLSTISQGSLDYCYILRGRCQKSLSPTFLKFQTLIWFSLELLLSSYFWRILRPVFSHFYPLLHFLCSVCCIFLCLVFPCCVLVAFFCICVCICISCVVYFVFSPCCVSRLCCGRLFCQVVWLCAECFSNRADQGMGRHWQIQQIWKLPLNLELIHWMLIDSNWCWLIISYTYCFILYTQSVILHSFGPGYL